MLKVIDLANKEIGYYDDHGRSKYFTDLFPRQHSMPWCVVFIEWIMLHSYGKEQSMNMLGLTDQYIYSVIAFMNHFKRNNHWHWKTVQKGWLIFLCMNNEWTNHVELVVDVDNDTIITIGGNCNGEVRKNTYSKNDPRISGFGRIDYTG